MFAGQALGSMLDPAVPASARQLFAFPDGRVAALASGATYYRLLGAEDGARIVLVCGIGFAWAAMPQTIARFASHGLRVLALDLFGRGGSEAPAKRYSHALYSRQLLELLDHVGWGRASIVGYSMGGGVATHFADCHPERVDKLILVAPSGLMELPLEGKLIAMPIIGDIVTHLFGRYILTKNTKKELAASAFASSPHVVHAGRVLEAHYQYSPGILRAFLSSVRYGPLQGSRNAFERVGKLFGTRVLCIWGTKDEILVPEKVLPIFRQCMPEASVVLLENAGHNVIFEDPDKVVIPIYEYLSAGRH
ncbi:Alpha/Beta hydrolase protein [Obelidium mucronatum]|nr:Alpha/Beta hydrolase protein [Obelidium mucronatum]